MKVTTKTVMNVGQTQVTTSTIDESWEQHAEPIVETTTRPQQGKECHGWMPHLWHSVSSCPVMSQITARAKATDVVAETVFNNYRPSSKGHGKKGKGFGYRSYGSWKGSREKATVERATARKASRSTMLRSGVRRISTVTWLSQHQLCQEGRPSVCNRDLTSHVGTGHFLQNGFWRRPFGSQVSKIFCSQQCRGR